MANTSQSAKAGTMTVGGSPVYINDWEFDGKADLPDTTDSETGVAAKAHVIGRREATFTVKGFVKTSSPQNVTLKEGTALSTVTLTADGTKKYAIASASVESCKVNAPIGSGDPITFEAVCKTNGDWTDYT